MRNEPAADSSGSAGIREVDVRAVPREQRHRLVFEAYRDLPVGEALHVLNDHEPRHLRDEFEQEFPGSFAWEPSPPPADGGAYRARITKRARTALPRIVADTRELIDGADADAAGSIWQLAPASRDLDSNVVALPPGGEIAAHDGPDLDVLILILHGSAFVTTESGTIPLIPGKLLWLPRTSQRRFLAGSDGVRYLTVHRRKPMLNITASPR